MFLLVLQKLGAFRSAAENGDELLLPPYLIDRYCVGLAVIVALAVTRFSRTGVG